MFEDWKAKLLLVVAVITIIVAVVFASQNVKLRKELAATRAEVTTCQDSSTSLQQQVKRLCLSCEVIFEAEVCPLCGGESFVPVTKWIEPLQPAAQSVEEPGREPGARGKQRARPRDPVSILFEYLHLRSSRSSAGRQ